MPRIEADLAATVRQALRVYLHDRDRGADPRDWDTAEAFVEWLERDVDAADAPRQFPAGAPGRATSGEPRPPIEPTRYRRRAK